MIGEVLMALFLIYPMNTHSSDIMPSFPIQNRFGVALQMVIAFSCIPAWMAAALIMYSGPIAENPSMQQQTITIIFAQAIIYAGTAGLFIMTTRAIKKILRTSFVKDLMRRDYGYHTRLFLALSILFFLISIITEWFVLVIITLACSLITLRLFIKGRNDQTPI